ncbi:hypothetical protein EG850_09355 [Gulosibacter macacae]|uniref:Uncharacterized protein n=1 Tax=Gulosibacter macacae TaxID=2488791 RepID=A0A3P3VU18_9MICO|nr:hypothetical protein [Gulosibacter macacae]RRJ86295.1 hypothetical protein EG850_09355 [Gulosibacter macacae]
MRATTIAIALATFVAWIASFLLFSSFTDTGREQLSQRGFMPMFGGWVVMSAIVVGGYALGYLVLRRFASGAKEFGEREVARLALGDAFLSACGGFALGFVPLSITAVPFMMFTWVMVIGVLFGFAILMPRYRANWLDEAAKRK